MLHRVTWLTMAITTSLLGCDAAEEPGDSGDDIVDPQPEDDEPDDDPVDPTPTADFVCQTLDTDTGGDDALVENVMINANRKPLPGKSYGASAFIQKEAVLAWCQGEGTMAVRDLGTGETTFHPIFCAGIAMNDAGEVFLNRITETFDVVLEQYASLDAAIAGTPYPSTSIDKYADYGGIAMTEHLLYRVGYQSVFGKELIIRERATREDRVVNLDGQDDWVAGIAIVRNELVLLTNGTTGASLRQELVRYDLSTGLEISRQATAFEGGAQGLVCGEIN